jgi:uncharacterized protein (TIGR02266 family)
MTERRTDPRFPLVLAVEYHGPRTPDVLRDYTENLSAGGLFVRTDRAFAVGERLTLVLSFPELLAPQDLDVEVVRLRAGGPQGPAGVAVVVPADAHASRMRLQELARAARTAVPGPNPFRLLLVEDNSLAAAMYTSALRRLSSQEGLGGLAIELAADGSEALERLRRPPPVDIVVTDVYLPGLTGLELLQAMRADAELTGTPVVVISSGNRDERERAARLGAQFFLQKPVKSQDLVTTLRTLLAARAVQGDVR